MKKRKLLSFFMALFVLLGIPSYVFAEPKENPGFLDPSKPAAKTEGESEGLKGRFDLTFAPSNTNPVWEEYLGAQADTDYSINDNPTDAAIEMMTNKGTKITDKLKGLYKVVIYACLVIIMIAFIWNTVSLGQAGNDMPTLRENTIKHFGFIFAAIAIVGSASLLGAMFFHIFG